MYIGALPRGVSQQNLTDLIEIQHGEEHILFSCTAKCSLSGIEYPRQVLIVTNWRVIRFNPKDKSLANDSRIESLQYQANRSKSSVTFHLNGSIWMTCEIPSIDFTQFERSVDTLNFTSNESGALSVPKVPQTPTSGIPTRADFLKRQELGQKIGPLTASANFGLLKGSVEIYANGYASVNGGKPDILLAISCEESTKTKSALGRGLGAVATNGLNMYWSKLRGQAYLAIATQTTAHSVHLEAPQPSQIESMHKLVAAGQAALKAREARSSATTTPEPRTSVSPGTSTSGQDLATQLKALTDLHASGALTDEEFARAKSRII
jgi:Short C-terminal domain